MQRFPRLLLFLCLAAGALRAAQPEAVMKDPTSNRLTENFIVPSGTRGFTTGRKLNKIGWRASSTCELHFDRCKIPAGNLLGTRGHGLRQTLAQISTGRILIGALGLGILQGSLDRSRAYMKERTAFGKALTEYQGVTFPLADAAAEVHAAHLLSLNVARLIDAGAPVQKELAMAKLFSTQAGARAVDRAIQTHGAMGFTNEMHLTEAYTILRKNQVSDGTNEILRRTIAKQLIDGDIAL